MKKRSSGILMHISSLNNNFGIGSFGDEAYEFVDFLVESGQKYWQILPLGHTSYGDSPYQCFSAFAGNPHFINFSILKDKRLLKEEDFKDVDFGSDEEIIDYGKIFENRKPILYKAYENFKLNKARDYDYFIEKNRFWLKDYAEYMAIKDNQNLVAWTEWPEKLRLRDEETLNKYREKLKDEIEFYYFIQYEFFEQWTSLKNYANSNGIRIIGDLPIYIAGDSADMWVNPEMFKVNEDMRAKFVAGCPPDCFAKTGQLWGNPIYDWEKMEKDGFKWWITRIKESLKLYDVIRLDHFIGFNSFWQIPAEDETAENGKWIKGPGLKLFDEIKKELGEVNIIAEDLGTVTEEFLKFKEKTGFPGMKVIQFSFGEGDSESLPHNAEKNSVSYVGTHDNETAKGWYLNNLDNNEGIKAKDYLDIREGDNIGFKFIRGNMSSHSNIAIMTMQDILNLDNKARMNTPSTLGGNWCWRIKKGALTKELAEKIYHLTKLYGRV